MFRKIIIGAGIMTLGASTLLADFSYQETSTITGGAIVSMLKVVGVFSKQARQAREPITSTVAVKGDRMFHKNAMDIQIIDLGKETITNIDLQKKTYTVMTFEQMRQMMAQMAEKMKENKNKQAAQGEDQTDVKFKVDIKGTGNAKQVASYDAKETVLTMTMEATDTKSGQSGSMVVIADEWLAPKVSGYDEVRDFQRRLAEKLNWTPGSNFLTSQPQMAKGMVEVTKENAKLDGIPVFTTVVMGGQGLQPVDRSDKPAGETKSQGPSVKSALGGALGGRFGLGRKKEPPQEQKTESNDAAAGQGVMLEMTTSTTGFSSAPVDVSQFEVPAGFKQIEPEMKGK